MAPGIYDTRRYHPAASGAEREAVSKRAPAKPDSTSAGSRVMCAECGQQALPFGAGLLCSQCRVGAPLRLLCSDLVQQQSWEDCSRLERKADWP